MRMKMEDELMRNIGKQCPFKVPDGYFERFSSELMTKLPERVSPKEERVTLWVKLKPLLYMAAMFVGAALIIRVASGERNVVESGMEITENQEPDMISDQMLDLAVEATMMDDYSLYVYLSDGNNE